METKLITLSGRVQGVGFRYHTKRIADQLNISGYAKNLTEDVEVLAIGEKSDLDLFIEQVIDNPAPGSRVQDYSIKAVEADNDYKNFKTL